MRNNRNGFIIVPRGTSVVLLTSLETKSFKKAAKILTENQVNWIFKTFLEFSEFFNGVNQYTGNFLIPVIDEQLPDILEFPEVDLNFMVAGQTVVLRDGTQDQVIACAYMLDETFDEEFPFFLVLQSGGASTRTADGRYGSGEESDLDIIDFF